MIRFRPIMKKKKMYFLTENVPIGTYNINNITYIMSLDFATITINGFVYFVYFVCIAFKIHEVQNNKAGQVIVNDIF